eukprot:COSAG01_NODE_1194_length_11305_cov_4.495806_2_plen_78_part_00
MGWGVIPIMGGAVGGDCARRRALARGGAAGTVTALTSLYPAVTILISVALRQESLCPNKLLGILFGARTLPSDFMVP